jgi:DNA invertase Pin-like site-specific DNA recombinase
MRTDREKVDKNRGNKKRTIGYLRVSTQEQDLEKNKADILMLANGKALGTVEWVEEKVSGTLDWRQRKIGEMIDTLNAGDAIIVSELSRLGRSTLQILEIMKVAKEKGISVFAVKGGWSLNGSMESKIVLTMLAMVAEIERDLISERTKEALRARKAAGVILGRPKGPGKSKLDSKREEIIALLRNGSKQTYVAERYGTTPANLNIWLRKRKVDYSPVLPQDSRMQSTNVKNVNIVK